MEYKHKRYLKNYLIAPRQQLFFGFVVLVSVLIAVGTHTLFLIKKIRVLAESGQLNYADADIELATYALQSFCITTVVIGIFVLVLNISFSHRVFGSLYKVEKYFREAAEGKTQGPITIRKYDLTGTMVEAINLFLKKQGLLSPPQSKDPLDRQ